MSDKKVPEISINITNNQSQDQDLEPQQNYDTTSRDHSLNASTANLPSGSESVCSELQAINDPEFESKLLEDGRTSFAMKADARTRPSELALVHKHTVDGSKFGRKNYDHDHDGQSNQQDKKFKQPRVMTINYMDKLKNPEASTQGLGSFAISVTPTVEHTQSSIVNFDGPVTFDDNISVLGSTTYEKLGRKNRQKTFRKRNDFKYHKFSCFRNKSNMLYGFLCPCVVYGLIMQKLYEKINLPIQKIKGSRTGKVMRLDTVMSQSSFSFGASPSGQDSGRNSKGNGPGNGKGSGTTRPLSPLQKKPSNSSLILAILFATLMGLFISFYFLYFLFDLYNGVGHGNFQYADTETTEINWSLFLCIFGAIGNAILMYKARSLVRREFQYIKQASDDIYNSLFCWYCSLWQMGNEVKIQKELRYYTRKLIPIHWITGERVVTVQPVKKKPKHLAVPGRTDSERDFY